MSRQIPLDLHGEGLRQVWKLLPQRCRDNAVAIWTQLVARAVRERSDTPDDNEEQQA